MSEKRLQFAKRVALLIVDMLRYVLGYMNYPSNAFILYRTYYMYDDSSENPWKSGGVEVCSLG